MKMNWRRGLLLAGIHLVGAVSLIVRQEAIYWRYTRTASSSFSTGLVRAAFQEEVAISFDPCNWFDLGYDQTMEVDAFANLPAALLTGWHDPCLTRTALGRASERMFGGRNHRAEIASCVALSAWVFIQWLLLGGFPLVHPRRWWLEPGASITLCAAIGILLSLLLHDRAFARIPEILAGLVWLWWMGLLMLRTVQFIRWAISRKAAARIA